MERDMDLVRRILLAVEKQGSDPAGWLADWWKGPEDEETVAYHVQLLSEAGLVELREITMEPEGRKIFPAHLTWKGHEFIEFVRDELRWQEIKERARNSTGTVCFATLQASIRLLIQDRMKQRQDARPTERVWSGRI